MNIVQIHSGLGNQMFQYALYLALNHFSETKLDSSIYAHRPSHNGYELERVFAIHPVHATLAERDLMADVSKDWFSEFRRGLGWHRRTAGQIVQEPDPAQGWSPDILHVTNSYLQGYWQSEHYFAAIKDEVRRAFTFRLPLPQRVQEVVQAIQSSPESVSVHIRRGDYLKPRRRDDFEVCTETYYCRAVQRMKELLHTPRFFIFSDEPDWIQSQDWFDCDAIYVRGNDGEEAYIDMQLMSMCSHHIIANSSFSWWGAWLGEQASTITLAPSMWFRHHPRPDIIPKTWQTIDAE